MPELYTRPYTESYTGGRYAPAYAPYDDAYLASAPFFELFPLDGGAFHVTNRLLGFGWDAAELQRRCVSGDILRDWRKADGSFDWDTVAGTDWGPVQYSGEINAFVNRLYFLAPVAQEYLKTGDERFALQWFDTLEDWFAKNPKDRDAADPSGAYRSTWLDMQVAWRLEVMLYSAFMLRGAKCIAEPRWHALYRMIGIHAEQIYGEAKGHIAKRFAHNHVLQIGTALLHAGLCFPELENAAAWREAGRQLVEINMKGAVLPDGGSIEACPSYSHFIVHLYIEALLLEENNGAPRQEELRRCIRSQYEWMVRMAAPDGNTLQVSDSYAMPVLRDLDLAERLLGETLADRRVKNAYLSDSRCAAVHIGDWSLYIDGLLVPQWHMHAGKPNVLLYFRGEPVLTDCGCCDYDRHDLHRYLGKEAQHNTVTVYGTGDDDKNGAVGDSIACTAHETGSERAFFAFRVTGERSGKAFSREREVTLTAEGLEIADTVRLDEAGQAGECLHLGAFPAENDGFAVRFLCDGVRLRLDIDNGETALHASPCPAAVTKGGYAAYTAVTAEKNGTQGRFIVRIGKDR